MHKCYVIKYLSCIYLVNEIVDEEICEQWLSTYFAFYALEMFTIISLS